MARQKNSARHSPAYGGTPKAIGQRLTNRRKAMRVRKAPGYMHISIARKETHRTPRTGIGEQVNLRREVRSRKSGTRSSLRCSDRVPGRVVECIQKSSAEQQLPKAPRRLAPRRPPIAHLIADGLAQSPGIRNSFTGFPWTIECRTFLPGLCHNLFLGNV
jgi:hypothetical protein